MRLIFKPSRLFQSSLLLVLSVVLVVPVLGAELRPGLVATANDGVRTVTFLVNDPNVTLAGRQSIHPQLKPQFHCEWSGVLTILREGRHALFFPGSVSVDGVECQGKPLNLAAGEHALKLGARREGTNLLQLRLEWESEFFSREPVPARFLGHNSPKDIARESMLTERGRALVEDLQCINCHQTSDKLLAKHRPPGLFNVGLKVRPEWLPAMLENPKHTHATARMPALPLSDRDRADVAAFLALLKTDRAEWLHKPDPKRQQSGADIYTQLGCRACHSPASNDLSRIADKFRFDGLMEYLLNPLRGNPNGKMPRFKLSRAEARDLADYLLSQSKPPAAVSAKVDGDPKRGRKRVETSGCAACHLVPGHDGPPVVNQLISPPLEKLRLTRGCLSLKRGTDHPWYDLKPEDRDAIVMFLQRRDVSPAPVQDFQRSVTRLDCVACHELRGPSRLVLPPNEAAPSLTDVGHKLVKEAVSESMRAEKVFRPWLKLRMPDYGDQNIQPVIDLCAAQAGNLDLDRESAVSPSIDAVHGGAKTLGKGEGGMGCINCHAFRDEPAISDIRGPEMTELAGRLRRDWMRRWLLDPGRVQPGTAMPSFFSNLPIEEARKQVGFLMDILSLGKGIPIPEGLGQGGKSFLVLSHEAPVLVRTFMPDSSPRSIAVGFKERQNICFDAEECRLRYAWVGDFVDMQGAWDARGGQPAGILGTKYYSTERKQPFQSASSETSGGAVFQGYSFLRGVPEFRYTINGLIVKEQITELPAGAGIKRTFEVVHAAAEAWFDIESFPNVEITSSVVEATPGRIRIPGGPVFRFELTIKARGK
ncbi:MAG TPA: c-type cytochrome [Roseimicrobium sp.]|nr:c-type cytochrome [Roseimicrobium sp.]